MQNEDVIEVEVCDQEKFKQLVDSQEEIGKNCLLGELTVCDAIKKGYFKRSGKFQSSEVIRDPPQSAEEKIKGMVKGDNNINAKDVWQNKIGARRTSIRDRGM